jgi:hypothetical protein
LSPVPITYPTWKETFGVRPTEDQLLDQVRHLDRLHTFWLLARINILLALDRLHRDRKETIGLQTYLVNTFIDEELFESLKKKFGLESLVDRQPFHSLQILTLMKRVILEGAREGGIRPDVDSEGAHRLGRCLLMVNDFLFDDVNSLAISASRPSSRRRKIALQLQVGSGLEVNNPPSIDRSIVRSDIIFNEIAEKIGTMLDVRALFPLRTGLNLEAYVDLIFGVLTHYMILDPKELIEKTGLACVNVKTYFAEADADSVERFWQLELATLDVLEEILRKPSRLKPQHNFIAFRQKPFVHVGEGNAVPIHVGFIQEKLESGLFWSIFHSLASDEERASLFRDWGRLFEQYISQTVLQALEKAPETYFGFPKFVDNNEEAFDGVVVAGDYCVVMEYKGGFLKVDAKYAEDEDEFIRDTEKKFGTEKRAGMEQLSRKVGAVFAAKPSQRRLLQGIDCSGVRIVVPIMIVQESFISSEITTPYLVEVFQTLKHKQSIDPKINCTFPLILDVSEIENLKPYLSSGKISFIDCIMERIRLGGSRFLSFSDFLREYRNERNIAPMKDPEMSARFEKIMDRISKRFFGKQFVPSKNVT